MFGEHYVESIAGVNPSLEPLSPMLPNSRQHQALPHTTDVVIGLDTPATTARVALPSDPPAGSLSAPPGVREAVAAANSSHRPQTAAEEAAARRERRRQGREARRRRRRRAVSEVIRERDLEEGHLMEEEVDDGDEEKEGKTGGRRRRYHTYAGGGGAASPRRFRPSIPSSSSSDGEDEFETAPVEGGGGLMGFLQVPIFGSNGKATTSGAAPRRKPLCPLLLFVPAIAIAIGLIVFCWVALRSGHSDVEALSSPRAVLIVVEGFSGTIFNEMMADGDGVHLPHLRRLLVGRGGVWSACPQVTDSRCARAVSVEEAVAVDGRPTQLDSNGNVVWTNNNNNINNVGLQSEERFSVYSAVSIATILSGVTPPFHQVQNNSLASMYRYAETSRQYPSVAKIVKDAGLQVTVLGTSHLLNSLGSSSWSCTEPGVLDMECPDSVASPQGVDVNEDVDLNYGGHFTTLECMGTTSCNVDVRRTKLPTNPREMSNTGIPEEQYRRILKDIFGSATQEKHNNAASGIQNDQFDLSGALNPSSRLSAKTSELFIFHFDSLAVRSESPSLPTFAYNSSSDEYHAQAYLIDSLIGQILAYVEDKSIQERENWLVLGVSDHGGNGKTVNAEDDFSTATPSTSPVTTSSPPISGGFDDRQLMHLLQASVVPFFLSTFTTASSERSYVTLKPLERPTSQLDVLPTLLRWLNVAPFDDETEAAYQAELTSTTATTEKSESSSSSSSASALEKKLAWRRQYEGTVQGICSSGAQPLDCVR